MLLLTLWNLWWLYKGSPSPTHHNSWNWGKQANACKMVPPKFSQKIRFLKAIRYSKNVVRRMANSASLGDPKSRLSFFPKVIQRLSKACVMQVLGKDSFLAYASQGIKVDYQMISGLIKGVSLNKKLLRKKFRFELSFTNLQQMASKFMSWNKLQCHSKSTKKPLTCKQGKKRSQNASPSGRRMQPRLTEFLLTHKTWTLKF